MVYGIEVDENCSDTEYKPLKTKTLSALTVVIINSCILVQRSLGSITTMSTHFKLFTASIAELPVSPEVPVIQMKEEELIIE